MQKGLSLHKKNLPKGTQSFVPATPVVQKKLKIGAPDDPLEVEADAVADKVVQQAQNPLPPKSNTGPLVQRKCSKCKDDELQKKPLAESISPWVQKKALSSGGDSVASDSVSQQIAASKGGGSTMNDTTRGFMENRFGNDFSQVRIHTDSNATQLSKSLNAQAFTVGNDIYFNEGKYNPSTQSGKHLLAHELTHTIQQSGVRRKIQKKDDLGDYVEPVFEMTDEQFEQSEEGEKIESYGIVQHDEGTSLWPNPDRTKAKLGLLPLNTRVFIDRKDKHGWYSVYVDKHQKGKSLPVSQGTIGYIPESRINKDMPDPDAWFFRITKDGQGALSVAGEVFPNHKPECLLDNALITAACKNDFRFLVNGLVAVNKAKSREFIHKDKLDDDWDKTKTKKGQIWVPGKKLMDSLKGQISSGSISYEFLSTAADIAIGIAAFIVGLLHGAVMSIVDVFVGIYDLIVIIKDIIVKLFKGTLVSDAKAFWNDISKITWADIKRMVGEKWNHPNTWDRWHFRGYVIGYAIVEILMLVFSGGAITAIKWAGKAGKFGKLASYLGKMKSVKKVMTAAEALKGKGIEKVRKALKAAHALSEGHGWAAKTLRISLSTLKRLSNLDIEKLKKLPQWAREKFARLTEKAKLRLLGCNSPCKVNVDEIQKALKLSTTGGKLLNSASDVLAALPKGLNKWRISAKLRKKNSALLTAIKEAKLTDKDFAKLADFLTPGDSNPAQAYRTFSRYLTSVVPAKTGKDIGELNRILALMIKAEPRRGAALKGAMFEQWVALHVPQLASKTFGRIKFDLKKLLGKTKKPFSRTVDKWVPKKGEIWDMKHQLSKIPTDQATDYMNLLGKIAPDGNTVKTINYLFPSEDAAKLNAFLKAAPYKFNVYYIDKVTNKLVKLP